MKTASQCTKLLNIHTIYLSLSKKLSIFSCSSSGVHIELGRYFEGYHFSLTCLK